MVLGILPMGFIWSVAKHSSFLSWIFASSSTGGGDSILSFAGLLTHDSWLQRLPTWESSPKSTACLTSSSMERWILEQGWMVEVPTGQRRARWLVMHAQACSLSGQKRWFYRALVLGMADPSMLIPPAPSLRTLILFIENASASPYDG